MPVRTTKACDLTDQLRERFNEWTPDWLDRKLEKFIPIFTYGFAKSDGKLAHYLSDAVPLGVARTITEKFVMERSELGYPVVFEAPGSPRRASIMGEVFLIHPRTLLTLDQMECNHEVFVRKTFFTFLLDQKVNDKSSLRPSIKAWMYVGIDKYWEDQATVKMTPKAYGNEKRIYEFLNDPFKVVDKEEPPSMLNALDSLVEQRKREDRADSGVPWSDSEIPRFLKPDYYDSVMVH